MTRIPLAVAGTDGKVGGPGGTPLPESSGVLAAVGTGVAATDVANLRAAHAAGVAAGKPVILPPGTYTVNDRIHSSGVTTDPVRFVALIPGTVTIQRTLAQCIIEASGSKSNAITLAADVAQGDSSFTVNALPTGGLNPEDQVELDSKIAFSTGPGSTAATVAELARVKTVTGSGPYTITLYGPLEEAYTVAAGSTVARVDFASAGTVVQGIKFRQTAQNRDNASFPLVRFNLCKELQIERCTFRDADVPGIEIKGVLDSDIDRCYFANLTDNLGSNFIGYGINIGGNCRDIRISRPVGRWVRHVVTTGWGTGDVGVPRHILIAHGQAFETSSGPWNTHKEGKFVRFVACESHNDKNDGFYIRAQKTSIIDPIVTGCGGRGVAFQEGEAADCELIGGRLESASNNSLVFWDSPRVRIRGTRVVGSTLSTQPNFKGGTATGGFVGSDVTIEDVHSTDRGAGGSGSHVQLVDTLGTNNIVRGGRWDSTNTRYVVQAIGATRCKIIDGPIGTNLFDAANGNTSKLENATNYVKKTSNYTLLSTDSVVGFDTTSGGLAATLPSAVAQEGKRYTIKRLVGGANTLTVATTSAQTIDGAASASLPNQWDKLTVVSDGANWITV